MSSSDKSSSNDNNSNDDHSNDDNSNDDHSNDELVGYLHDEKYSVKKSNIDEVKGGYTMLIAAAKFGNYEYAHLLMENGANLDAQMEYLGYTALMFAVERRHYKIAFELIKRGADVNIKDNQGYTVLMIAVINDNLELVNKLLEKGADVDPELPEWGLNALYFAENDTHNRKIIKALQAAHQKQKRIRNKRKYKKRSYKRSHKKSKQRTRKLTKSDMARGFFNKIRGEF